MSEFAPSLLIQKRRKSFGKQLASLFHRPWVDNRLMLKAYLLLGVAARRIGWAVRAVSNYTPWQSNCFPQALTAKILLRNREIPSTLYMGAAFRKGEAEKGEPPSSFDSQLTGHVWLRCGSEYITGGDAREEYGAVVAFGH